jgi:hypothetical protein
MWTRAEGAVCKIARTAQEAVAILWIAHFAEPNVEIHAGKTMKTALRSAISVDMVNCEKFWAMFAAARTFAAVGGDDFKPNEATTLGLSFKALRAHTRVVLAMPLSTGGPIAGATARPAARIEAARRVNNLTG